MGRRSFRLSPWIAGAAGEWVATYTGDWIQPFDAYHIWLTLTPEGASVPGKGNISPGGFPIRELDWRDNLTDRQWEGQFSKFSTARVQRGPSPDLLVGAMIYEVEWDPDRQDNALILTRVEPQLKHELSFEVDRWREASIARRSHAGDRGRDRLQRPEPNV